MGGGGYIATPTPPPRAERVLRLGSVYISRELIWTPIEMKFGQTRFKAEVHVAVYRLSRGNDSFPVLYRPSQRKKERV